MDPNNQQTPPPNIFAPTMPGQAPHPMIDLPEEPKKPVVLIVMLVVFILATVTLAVLSFLFYTQMVEYRDEYEKKAAIAVEAAKIEQEKQLNAQFAEQEKEPTLTYIGPASAASVKIVYPKTWSTYEVQGRDGSTVNSYFNPKVVQDITNRDNVFALRLEVIEKTYDLVTKEFQSKAAKGEVKIKPFQPTNVEGADPGVRIEGVVRADKVGTMVILPVRDKTIRIWTESGNFTKDFDNFVVKNLEFSP